MGYIVQLAVPRQRQYVVYTRWHIIYSHFMPAVKKKAFQNKKQAIIGEGHPQM